MKAEMQADDFNEKAAGKIPPAAHPLFTEHCPLITDHCQPRCIGMITWM